MTDEQKKLDKWFTDVFNTMEDNPITSNLTLQTKFEDKMIELFNCFRKELFFSQLSEAIAKVSKTEAKDFSEITVSEFLELEYIKSSNVKIKFSSDKFIEDIDYENFTRPWRF